VRGKKQIMENHRDPKDFIRRGGNKGRKYTKIWTQRKTGGGSDVNLSHPRDCDY